jgi:uncharacterized Zn finger protein (UPF0148 family)
MNSSDKILVHCFKEAKSDDEKIKILSRIEASEVKKIIPALLIELPSCSVEIIDKTVKILFKIFSVSTIEDLIKSFEFDCKLQILLAVSSEGSEFRKEAKRILNRLVDPANKRDVLAILRKSVNGRDTVFDFLDKAVRHENDMIRKRALKLKDELSVPVKERYFFGNEKFPVREIKKCVCGSIEISRNQENFRFYQCNRCKALLIIVKGDGGCLYCGSDNTRSIEDRSSGRSTSTLELCLDCMAVTRSEEGEEYGERLTLVAVPEKVIPGLRIYRRSIDHPPKDFSQKVNDLIQNKNYSALGSLIYIDMLNEEERKVVAGIPSSDSGMIMSVMIKTHLLEKRYFVGNIEKCECGSIDLLKKGSEPETLHCQSCDAILIRVTDERYCNFCGSGNIHPVEINKYDKEEIVITNFLCLSCLAVTEYDEGIKFNKKRVLFYPLETKSYYGELITHLKFLIKQNPEEMKKLTLKKDYSIINQLLNKTFQTTHIFLGGSAREIVRIILENDKCGF